MKKLILGAAVLCSALCMSCDDELDVRIPFPTNITLNELKLDFSKHNVPDGGFSSQGIHFNTVKAADGQLAGGFCYSNRLSRSYPWKGDVVSVDSMRYSVFNRLRNNTETYAVCHVNGDDAFFTLEQPRVIEYILVANTTWTYYSMLHGDKYCRVDKETGEEFPVKNPYVPSEPLGIWYTYVPGGVKKFTTTDKDYMLLTAKGYNGGKETGTVKFYLACKGANPDHPTWNYIHSKWERMDLATLGEVDKVVFYLDSSDKDENGRMRTPAWFCVDGIQLKNQ